MKEPIYNGMNIIHTKQENTENYGMKTIFKRLF